MSRQNQLKEGVKKAYSLVAEMPGAKHPFPSGRAFAESVGYPAALLNTIPAAAAESFSGTSNVSVFAEIPLGSVVLDLGCGAALDSIIASRKTGPDGKVICLDFSEEMLSKARYAADAADCRNIEFHLADAEEITLPDSSIDIALVNGIFNLNPAREKVFSELGRVIKPNGSVYAAELVYKEPQQQKSSCSINDWFRWIAGAKDAGSFLCEFTNAGFSKAVILKTTTNERTASINIVVADVHAVK